MKDRGEAPLDNEPQPSALSKPLLKVRGRSTPAEALDEAALRYAFHAAKWCKDGGPGHAMAHDDEDEDGIRARFITAYNAAHSGVVTIDEHGHEEEPDHD